MLPPNALRMRGGPRLSLMLQRLVGKYNESIVAEAAPDIRVSFDGFDRYWMRVFFRGDLYEPELYRLFSRIKRLREHHLIDGGANIGFWSAILTSSLFGISRAVAVEASPTTYVELERTAELCGGRFATEHCALTRETGVVQFDQEAPHAGRHIVRDGGARNLVTVPATTIDALVAKYGLEQRDLIVKLDVEGAELDCIRGGTAAFRAGAIFIYEDHGKDPTSSLTGSLLEADAACWFIEDDGSLRAVHSAADASALKPDPKRGYNFLCTSRTVAAEHPLAQRLFS